MDPSIAERWMVEPPAGEEEVPRCRITEAASAAVTNRMRFFWRSAEGCVSSMSLRRVPAMEGLLDRCFNISWSVNTL